MEIYVTSMYIYLAYTLREAVRRCNKYKKKDPFPQDAVSPLGGKMHKTKQNNNPGVREMQIMERAFKSALENHGNLDRRGRFLSRTRENKSWPGGRSGRSHSMEKRKGRASPRNFI